MPKFSENNAIKILTSFSKKEIRAFEQYFKRLYPEKEVALEVFFLLKKYHQKFYPNFPENGLIREKVAEKLYGDYENRIKKLNENLFELANRFREFLLWQELKENTFERDILECQIFERRNMPKFTNNLMKKMEKRLPEKVGLDYHFERFRLTWRQLESSLHDGSQLVSDLLQTFMYQSDIFYFGLKANLFCTAIARERIFNHEFDYSLEEKFFEEVYRVDYLNKIEYLRVFSTLFNLTKTPDEAQFLEIFYSYKKLYHLFDEKEQSEIFSLLQNVIVRFPFALEKKGAKMYFELYKFGLKSGIILYGNYITPGMFVTVVNSSIKMGELKWSESFINRYKSYLPKNYENDIVSFSMMRLNFERENFVELMEFFQKTTFKNITMKLSKRVFEIKTIFELYFPLETEDLFNKVMLAQKFLIRNKSNLTITNYQSHHNFLLILKRFISAKFTNQELLYEIEIIGACAYKNWLFEKLK